MTIYVDGAYNLAEGTRNAFGALSADLVAEGHPEIVVTDGDREPEEQLAIWYDRMTLDPGGRTVYGTAWWNGELWYRIHPWAVGAPGSSNHERRRANDLGWPYNDSGTAAHLRARQLCERHDITWEGAAFDEDWHWTFWGPLGHIGKDPAPAPATIPVRKEDTMTPIIWNGRVWLVGFERVAYVRNLEALSAAKKLTGVTPAEYSNDELTEVQLMLGIPWEAMDATYHSRAFDNLSNFGKGAFWSRQMAIEVSETLSDKGFARSLDELLKRIPAVA